MNVKVRLTRSGPLQMQIVRPSKSFSLFPIVSNNDNILGSYKCNKRTNTYTYDFQSFTNSERLLKLKNTFEDQNVLTL